MHEIWHVFLVLPQLLLARGELGPQASQLGLGLVSQHDAHGFGGGICGAWEASLCNNMNIMNIMNMYSVVIS